jgi:hypothetical protein
MVNSRIKTPAYPKILVKSSCIFSTFSILGRLHTVSIDNLFDKSASVQSIPSAVPDPPKITMVEVEYPRFNELALNITYTILIAGSFAGVVSLRLSKLYGTPTYRILILIYLHQLLFCFSQQTLNGYSLLVPLKSYNVWYLLLVKYIECYSKNAFQLFDLVSALMYLDITRSAGYFRIKDICQSQVKHRILNACIVVASLLTGVVALSLQTDVLPRTNYMYISNPDKGLLRLIVYSFGWTAILGFFVLIVKWYDFWAHRSKAVDNVGSAASSSMVFVLRVSAFICTVQNVLSVSITIVPGLFGINQSVDPWVTMRTIISMIPMPFHSIIPFYIALADQKKCSCGASGARKRVTSNSLIGKTTITADSAVERSAPKSGTMAQ